jgi:hypothetical protein
MLMGCMSNICCSKSACLCPRHANLTGKQQRLLQAIQRHSVLLFRSWLFSSVESWTAAVARIGVLHNP